MTDNFPLFRLPFIPLYKVLDHVRPEVILPLSFCSKRAKSIMKNYNGPSKRVNISFDLVQYGLKVNDTTLISVSVVPELPTHVEKITIGALRVPVEMDDGILKAYWTDKIEGMAAIIEYTLDVFHGKLHSMKADVAFSADDLRFWMEWIKTFQGKIHKMSVFLVDTDHPDQLTKYILESDFVTGDLDLQLPTPDARWPPLPSLCPYSMDYLYLSPAHWVTLDHFLAMDLKKIFLRSTCLTCQDVNVFLKKWINGECSKRVKEITLGISRGIDFAVLFNDIEFTRRDRNSIGYYAGYKGIEQIVGGFDIRRKSDGAMATIMNKYGGLKILFWPDNEGNPHH